MSTRRAYTDDALSLTLDRWMADGPRELPEQVLEDALRSVATAHQRRWRGRLLRVTGASSPAVPLGLTVAAVATVALVAVGLGLRGVALPPGVSTPTASAQPSASEAPSGYRWFRDDALGYEVLVPTRWDQRDRSEPVPGSHRFGFAHSDAASPSFFGAMEISVGAADGKVEVCAPRLCREFVVYSIQELDEVVVTGVTLPQRNAIREEERDITLAGEPGRWKEVRLKGGYVEAGPAFHQVFAIHDGRPIVLTFDIYDGATPCGGCLWVDIERIVRSFHFLEATPEPSQDADLLPDGTRPYVDREQRFSLVLPLSWVAVQERGDLVELSSPNGHIWFHVGEPDGTLRTCDEPRWSWDSCPTIQGSSAQGLAAAILADGGGPAFRLLAEPSVVGGEDGLRLRPVGVIWPWVSDWVLVHDGLPYLIELESSLSTSPDEAFDIVGSLEFLD